MNDDFKQYIMKCLITDFLDHCLFDYLWHYLHVCHYIWQTACWLQFETMSESDVELCQHFAIWWHQFSGSSNLFVSLPWNISKTGKFYTHHARLPSVLWFFSHMHRPDWKLTGEKPINKSSICKYFVDISRLSLEHMSIVLKSYWTFELESAMKVKWRLLISNTPKMV